MFEQMKKKAAGHAGQKPAPPPAPPSDLPYGGILTAAPTTDETNRERGRGEVALTAPHLLVSGRTGSGKSRSVLGPNIVMWGSRPVVAMSSKGDLAEMTIKKRSTRGPVYLLDLSGEVRESELQDVPVTHVRCDPCALIETDDDALAMASLLIEVGGLASGNSGGGSSDSFWSTLAMRPLAALLRAGGYYVDDEGDQRWGGGIRWVLDACEDPGQTADDADNVDLDAANWVTAIARNAGIGGIHGPSLIAARALDPRQRDSIGINCRVALSAWAMQAVAGAPGQKAFSPDMLETPGATLYIVSPMTGAAAPAASAVLTQIVNHWRKRVGDLPEILFVLDELPNGAPLPRLAAWVGEARGLGVRIVAAVQATSQFEPRWGAAGLKILREIFPAILVLPGAPEKEILETAAWAAGQAERLTASTDAAGKVSHSRDMVDLIKPAELLPQARGQGRLILGGRPGVLVALPDIAKTDLLD